MSNYFLPNPEHYNTHFDESWEVTQWTAEGGATITRELWESDDDHPLCMKVVSDTDGKGVYIELTDQYPSTKYLFEFSYLNASGQEIDYEIYDQTNTASISTGSLTATVWSNHYQEFTCPAGCVTIRIYLRAGTASGNAFYVDDIKCQGNAIAIDPEVLPPRYPREGQDHVMIDSSVVSDRSLPRFQAELRFPLLTAAQFDRILDVHKNKKDTYFDDQDVPPAVKRQTLYTETTYNFVGITNPSGSHIAWSDTSSSEPSAKGDFETTEFTTADYQAIDADDSSNVADSASSTGDFAYQKFRFDVSGEYTVADQVRNISIVYKGLANDVSDANQDGVILYAWNSSGGNWVKLGETRTSDKETISMSLTKPEQAQMFVDTGDGYIRLLAQTRATKAASKALSVTSYWMQVIVNKDLDGTIGLRNAAVLTAGDVVSVENLTDGTTLVLTTDYTIGDDRKSVIVIGQDAGAVIEVKHNQYHKVRSGGLQETRIKEPGTPTAPKRSATLTLIGLLPIE